MFRHNKLHQCLLNINLYWKKKLILTTNILILIIILIIYVNCYWISGHMEKNHKLPEDGPELRPKYFGVTINT